MGVPSRSPCQTSSLLCPGLRRRRASYAFTSAATFGGTRTRGRRGRPTATFAAALGAFAGTSTLAAAAAACRLGSRFCDGRGLDILLQWAGCLGLMKRDRCNNDSRHRRSPKYRRVCRNDWAAAPCRNPAPATTRCTRPTTPTSLELNKIWFCFREAPGIEAIQLYSGLLCVIHIGLETSKTHRGLLHGNGLKRLTR